MATVTQPDTRTNAAKAATSRIHVGPHNILQRNGFVWNDRTLLEGAFVDDFTGFEKADINLNEDPNPQDDGASGYRSFRGGRTMTMTGDIVAGSYPTLINIGATMEDSLLELVEMPLVISVNPASPFFTQPTVYINCRVSDFTLSKQIRQEDRSGEFKRAYTVALRATNPRYLSLIEKTAFIIPTVTTIKGRIYSRTYPLVYATLLDSTGHPSVGGNNVTVSNVGNWNARPRLRFTGPMGGIGLRNSANGDYLRLKYDIAAGDYIEVDVSKGTVYDSLGNPRSSYHDTATDWLELAGKRGSSTGDNPLTLEVTTFSTGSRLDFWWKDTSL